MSAPTCFGRQGRFRKSFGYVIGMDGQPLVLKQLRIYHGYVSGQVDYVKFVPLTDKQVSGFGKAIRGF